MSARRFLWQNYRDCNFASLHMCALMVMEQFSQNQLRSKGGSPWRTPRNSVRASRVSHPQALAQRRCRPLLQSSERLRHPPPHNIIRDGEPPAERWCPRHFLQRGMRDHSLQ